MNTTTRGFDWLMLQKDKDGFHKVDCTQAHERIVKLALNCLEGLGVVWHFFQFWCYIVLM